MNEDSSTATPLSEREIKAAVVDYLAQRKALDDGVVINELPVANWSRRADLAVANGKLQAIEIKSDLDSLRRLDGQVALFSSRFDKVVLVTTHRFLSAALERLPVEVEVWEASRGKLGVVLRVVRRGKTQEIRNHHILASYLLKPELMSFLRLCGLQIAAGASRDELEKAVALTPINKLRKFVLERLKSRYRREQDSPLLTRLERSGGANPVCTQLRTPKKKSGYRVAAGARGLERYSEFEAKFGNLPDDMPTSVRVRLTRK